MEDNQSYFESEVFQTKEAKKTMKRFAKSMGQQKIRLAIVLSSVLFYTLFMLFAPYYSAVVIDLIWNNIQAAKDTGIAFSITWQKGGSQLLLVLFLYLGSGIFYALQSFLMTSFAEKLNLQMRGEISRKLNRLPLAYFDQHQVGEVMSRATNDLEKMSEALQTGLLRLFTAFGTIVGALIMMFSFSVSLTVIFLVFTGISLFITKIVSAKTLSYATERQQYVGRMNGLIEEFYSGRVIIKAFHNEEASAKRVAEVAEKLAKATQKTDFIVGAINPLVRMVNRFGHVGMAVLGGFMLLDGRMSPGRFQAFFQYMNNASEPLTELSYMINTMQSALASVERVYALLDEEEMVPETSAPLALGRAKGEVAFEKVRFGYTPDHMLMEDISFTAKVGQKIAIVGSTGAGKTTLINLLMNFYEVNGGRILVDGVDVKKMTRQELRENFGMVLQDTWLFGGTIAENIAYGKPDATREEIVAAAKAARADFFIRTMPHEYDTLLTNDAESISVGQKQLLTIARMVLRNPAILILDEATSSVDTRTELEIGKAMKMLMENRTSFVIAHRLSTIVDADLILLMEQGNIIEQGNHRELLQAKGRYADLYQSQFA